MLAHALAPRCAWWAWPRADPDQPHAERREISATAQLSPLGRSSSSADVAATVRFALENASITGTTLLVDGGQHLMRFERDFSLM
jgi:NAD(P)-dependent dehydrogenase (short-subunit alcohol dehydrogenase family)